jgi:hypothetical protein
MAQLYLVDPVGTTKYRVEAVPIGDCFETPIIKYIIVRGVGVAPDMIIADPGPQCGEMDFGILDITDGMLICLVHSYRLLYMKNQMTLMMTLTFGLVALLDRMMKFG